MLKKTLALVLVHLCLLFSAQSKLNLALLKQLKSNTGQTLTLLVKGNVSKIKSDLQRTPGCTFNYAAGDILSATLPLSYVRQLADQPYVERLEFIQQKLQPLDDSSLRKNNILRVHAGNFPLTMPYTGQGVLIGLIDTGTDVHHKDFKDSLGNSRIAWMWDQRPATASNTPMPYNYGQEWNAAAINNGQCTHDDNVSMSHGTKVAGVAAGNGATAHHYRGIAPDANLITVAINFNSSGPIITDALHYIINKANLMGRPLVVNISLGDYYGSHDGKDLQAQMMDNMLNNAPGRIMVAAAGNAGQVPFHLGYTVSSADTNYTWLYNSTPTINFQVYADSADLKNVRFRIGAHEDVVFSYKGHTHFLKMDSVMGIVHTDSLMHNGNRIATIQTSGDLYAGVYGLDVTIIADTLNLLWAFETNGVGKLDSWCFDYVYSGFPTTTLLPSIVDYKRPDTLKTICGSYQCSDQVITVANYTDRPGYIDATGTYTTFPGTDNDIFNTSSIGPTRDNRVKPEIAATGENIVSVGALPVLTWLLQNFPYNVTHDSLHMIFGGTSAAAGCVAGLAALYLEKYPTATVHQLRNDIINCSLKDNFTGTTPNNVWGYGKLDGFGALICSMPPPNPVGLKEQQDEGFRIYPNPARDIVIVESAGYPEMVIITDLLGRTVTRFDITSSKQSVDLKGLAPGIYLVHDRNTTVTKLIKVD